MLKYVAFFSQKIPVLAGALIPLAIIFSVVREYAFFFVAGLQWFQLLSTLDYLRNCVMWAPGAFAILGFSLWLYDSDRYERERLEKRGSTIALKARNGFWELFGWNLFTIAVIGLFNRNIPYSLVAMGLAYFLLRVAIFVLARLTTKSEMSATLLPVYFAVILLVAPGMDDAEAVLMKTTPDIVMTTSEWKGRSMVLVRLLDRGVLVKAVDSRGLSFVPWDDIKGMESLQLPIEKPKRPMEDLGEWVGDYIRSRMGGR